MLAVYFQWRAAVNRSAIICKLTILTLCSLKHGAIPLRAVEDVFKQIYDKVPSKKDVNCGFNVKTDGRTFDLLAEVSDTFHSVREGRFKTSSFSYVLLYYDYDQINPETLRSFCHVVF